MFRAFYWNTFWRVCVCAFIPSLMLLLTDVRLGYWNFMNSIDLVICYPINTSLLYEWVHYWICVWRWFWFLLNPLLCVQDQVLVLDLWYKKN